MEDAVQVQCIYHLINTSAKSECTISMILLNLNVLSWNAFKGCLYAPTSLRSKEWLWSWLEGNFGIFQPRPFTPWFVSDSLMGTAIFVVCPLLKSALQMYSGIKKCGNRFQRPHPHCCNDQNIDPWHWYWQLANWHSKDYTEVRCLYSNSTNLARLELPFSLFQQNVPSWHFRMTRWEPVSGKEAKKALKT